MRAGLRFSRRDLLLALLGVLSVALLWLGKGAVAAQPTQRFFWIVAAQAALCAAGTGLIWNRGSSRLTTGIVIGVAVLLRLSLLTQTPALSDDIYRYIWDGRVQAARINPYRYIPADPHLAFLRDAQIYPHINRRDYAPTIYPPLAQVFFWAVTRVSESVIWFKAVLLLLEGGTLWLLAQLLGALNFPRARLLVYAWNPLVLWEFSSGHIDLLMTPLVLLALLAHCRKRSAWAGIFLGAATLVKFFPLVLLPAFYKRRQWRLPIALGLTIALSYLPYLSVGRGVFGFLFNYAGEEGMATGRFFLLLLARHLSGGAEIPAWIYFVFCAALIGWLVYPAISQRAHSRGAFLRYAGSIGGVFMFLLSPQYPWYWLWMTPWLAFVPRPFVWPLLYVSCAALLQYADWFDGSRWINPYLACDLLQFGPAILAAGALYFWRRRSAPAATATSRPLLESVPVDQFS